MGHLGARIRLGGFDVIGLIVYRRLGVLALPLSCLQQEPQLGKDSFNFRINLPFSHLSAYSIIQVHPPLQTPSIFLTSHNSTACSSHKHATPVAFRHNPRISGNNFAVRLGPYNFGCYPSVPSSSHTVSLTEELSQ